ncbi:MAG TPA: DUF3291 domain-containing protein [Casimicrobiaceae bacterium]|jgi:hypothetical protein
MSAYELAQLNIGVLRGPIGSPIMAEFVANLDRVNALADGSPGFAWRLQTEEGNATAIRPFDDENVAVNLSVWRDMESLTAFVYRSAHVDIMRRRREWFERMDEAFLVLWWVPKGHRPTVQEAIDRLQILRADGPTREAFTFRHPFPAPDAPQGERWTDLGGACPAT